MVEGSIRCRLNGPGFRVNKPFRRGLLFLIHAARMGIAIINLHRLMDVTVQVATPHLDVYSREFARLTRTDNRMRERLYKHAEKEVVDVKASLLLSTGG